ncbi:hypothetical protein ACQ4PT_002475 [Festuca glaucescens]
MDRRPELRRSMTLSEQLATPDPAIREFLRIPDDDSHHHPDADAGGRGWKPLRDRLRLRRTANAWTAPSQKPSALRSGGGGGGSSTRSNKYIYAPGEATAAFSRTTSLRQTPTFSRVASTRVGPTAGRAERAAPVVVDDHDDEDDEEDDEGDKDQDEAPAAQMSLMALLEQTDSWDDEDEEEDDAGGGGGGKNAQQQAGGGDDDEDDGEGREEEMVHVCCVCMVRHKGAAFIPCGHTFCRLCSRELWVSRGNCPLCNGFIQEILDIF